MAPGPAVEAIAGVRRWRVARRDRARAPVRRAGARRRLRRPGRRPTRGAACGSQHRPRVAAQCRAVDDDDLNPVEAAQRAPVEHQLPAFGQPAAQHRGEGFPAVDSCFGYRSQDRVGDGLGSAAGQQRARGGHQRTVGRLFQVLLDRAGHCALGGVNRRVDGPSTTTCEGSPSGCGEPDGCGPAPIDEMTGTTGACGRCGEAISGSRCPRFGDGPRLRRFENLDAPSPTMVCRTNAQAHAPRRRRR
ncbi:hypothetical protein I552_8206 [Mycobacterium xenopi 3993]|nr:hypothetical protein I552_8206 [Mycobacterium xenopi 3993]